MAIRDLGYRPYGGRYLPHRSRYRVMVGRTLRSAWTTSRLLRILLIVSPGPMVVYGVLMYLQLKAMQLGGGKSPISLPMEDPAELVFQCQIWSQLWFSFAVSMVVAAPTVAEDLRTGALPFYFSRPVSRAQYLLGKVLPAALLVFAVSTLPALVLAVMRVGLAPDGADALKHLWLIPKTLIFTPLYLGVFSLLPAALGSLGRRTGAVRGLWAGFFFLTWMLGNGLAEATDISEFAVISPVLDMMLVGQALFGVEPEYSLPWILPAAVLFGYFAIAGLLLHRRLLRAGVM